MDKETVMDIETPETPKGRDVLLRAMEKKNIHPLEIRGKKVLPIIQGGMGVGISAHKLAGTVAQYGAVGTIASVGLRHLHPDLLARSIKSRNNNIFTEANREALDREIRGAQAIRAGSGLLAVNIMRAITEWKEMVLQACKSGADAIVMGAGLPLDLPKLTAAFPDVALIPILSESRGVEIVVKRWMRFGRLPDAIVIEHPRYAGGHLGAKDTSALCDHKFDLDEVLPEVFAVFDKLGIKEDAIPIIPAGGINSPDKIRTLISLGARGVQVGTPFAVTKEGDAHENFKRVLINAEPEDIRTFMSTAGLPARAVCTPWLKRYLEREERIRAAHIKHPECVRGVKCLEYCGLTDVNPTAAGRFCIEVVLAEALRGNVERGLFFRGSEPLPFKDIRPVRDLLEYFLAA